MNYLSRQKQKQHALAKEKIKCLNTTFEKIIANINMMYAKQVLSNEKLRTDLKIISFAKSPIQLVKQ